MTPPPEEPGGAIPDDPPGGTTAALRRRRLRPGLPRRKAWLAPTGRTGRAVSVVAMIVVALGALAFLVVDRITALPTDAVLRAGGVTVTEAEFQRRVGVLSGLYGAQVPADGADRDRFQRDVAQAVATSIVVHRVAAERGMVAPEQDAQKTLEQVIATQFGGDRMAFARSLGALQVSEPDVLGEIRRQQTTIRVAADVTAAVPPVSDAEVAASYAARQAEMVIPERRRLRNIVVDSEAKARALADRARGGADVAALASTASQDRSTAPAGGDLGVVAAAQLEPAVADPAFAVPVNGIYGPAQSRFGWNVGKVEEIQAAQPQSLDQVREPLRGQLTEQRKADRWNAWLTDQVRAAKVEYADRYRPANPDVLPPSGMG